MGKNGVFIGKDFPKTIDGETRWLEYAEWLEEADYEDYDGRCWWPIKWLN